MVRAPALPKSSDPSGHEQSTSSNEPSAPSVPVSSSSKHPPPPSTSLPISTPVAAPPSSSPIRPLANKRRKVKADAGGGMELELDQDLVGEALDLVGQRRRRKRVRYSCSECHRRRAKCSRKQPCQSCVDRGCPEACRPCEEFDVDIYEHARLLEGVLSRILETSHSMPLELKRGQRSPPATSDGQMGWIKDCSFTSQQDPKRSHAQPPGNSQIGTAATRPRSFGGCPDDLPSGEGVSSATSRAIEAQAQGRTWKFGATASGSSSLFNYQRLKSHGHYTTSKLYTGIISRFPSLGTTRYMVDLYFDHINDAIFPIDRVRFQQDFQRVVPSLWDTTDPNFDAPVRQQAWEEEVIPELSTLAVILVILVFAYRCLPPNMGIEQGGERASHELAEAVRQVLRLHLAIDRADINVVVSWMLLSRSYVVVRHADHEWFYLGVAIRTAYMQRLNIDGSRLKLDPYETEQRRRLWSHLFYMDRTQGVLLGRSPTIHTDFTNSGLPTEFSSEVKFEDGTSASRSAVASDPWSSSAHYGVGTFLSLRQQFAVLTGDVLAHFHNVHATRSYAQVCTLDSELVAFQKSMPLVYQLDFSPRLMAAFHHEPQAATDKEAQDVVRRLNYGNFNTLACHRHLLNMEFAFVRISLHQPYILRDSVQYSLSRQAAIDAAVHDRRARMVFAQESHWDSSLPRPLFLVGQFRHFNAATVFGLSLVQDPSGPRAQEYVAYLREFIAEAQQQCRERTTELDPVSDREVSDREIRIVKMFLRVKEMADSHELGSVEPLQEELPTALVPLMPCVTTDSTAAHPGRTHSFTSSLIVPSQGSVISTHGTHQDYGRINEQNAPDLDLAGDRTLPVQTRPGNSRQLRFGWAEPGNPSLDGHSAISTPPIAQPGAWFREGFDVPQHHSLASTQVSAVPAVLPEQPSRHDLGSWSSVPPSLTHSVPDLGLTPAPTYSDSRPTPQAMYNTLTAPILSGMEGPLGIKGVDYNGAWMENAFLSSPTPLPVPSAPLTLVPAVPSTNGFSSPVQPRSVAGLPAADLGAPLFGPDLEPNAALGMPMNFDWHRLPVDREANGDDWSMLISMLAPHPFAREG